MPDTDTDVEALECLNGHGDPEGCRGQVAYRMPLSGTGTPFPRCDGHWEQRLKLEDRLRSDYPDTPNPPDWFDPTAAGEHWDIDY